MGNNEINLFELYELPRYVEIAYKKLKNSIFFDKSNSLRSAFKNYLDLFVAVECNKDINYFSNVMESLCRDMHCYCLQVNTSDYGDSRLIKPASSVKMNMMRIKGGRNEAILVEDIDIYGLRNFQRKQYELQRDEKDNFKTTPPGFDVSIVDAKRLVKRIKEEIGRTKKTKRTKE